MIVIQKTINSIRTLFDKTVAISAIGSVQAVLVVVVSSTSCKLVRTKPFYSYQKRIGDVRKRDGALN